MSTSLSQGKQFKKRRQKPRPVANKRKHCKGKVQKRRFKGSKIQRIKKQVQISVCSQGQPRRWAGCTGLEDVPLLPPLFTNVEDTYTRTLVLQVYLRLCARAQVKPVGIQVDDLESSFHLLTTALQAAMPALVRTELIYRHEGLGAERQKWIDDGGVIIDQVHHRVYGLLLGQDPLHIFFRLSQAIEWQSLDSAWALRCLRKLLRSWNFEAASAGEDEGFARAEQHHDLVWIHVSDASEASVAQILKAYFGSSSVPSCAWDVLSKTVHEAWYFWIIMRSDIQWCDDENVLLTMISRGYDTIML